MNNEEMIIQLFIGLFIGIIGGYIIYKILTKRRKGK